MNQINLIGYLTADPTTRTINTGKTVTSFTIGVTRSRKDANGNKQSDFFRITTWGATADFCGKYLTKGSRVAVTGEVNLNSYNGNRYSLDVQADHVENLTERKHEKKQETNERQDISSGDLPWRS